MADRISNVHAVKLKLLLWLSSAVLIWIATSPKGQTAFFGQAAGLTLTFGLLAGLTSPVLLTKTRQLLGTNYIGIKLAALALITHGLYLVVLSSAIAGQGTVTFRLLGYSVPFPIGVACYAILLSMIPNWRTNCVAHKEVLLRDLLLALLVVGVMATWVSADQFLELFLLRRPNGPSAFVYLTMAVINTWMFVILPLGVLLVQRRFEPRQIGYTFAVRAIDLWYLAVATAAATAVVYLVPVLGRMAWPFPGEPGAAHGVRIAGDLSKVAVTFLASLGFVALPEELIFRGILLSFLKDRFPQIGKTGAVLLSSCAFAIGHLTQGVYVLVISLCLGIILGALFVRTRNLVTPIFLHAVLDTIS